jgi:branched-subunit amino acid permease
MVYLWPWFVGSVGVGFYQLYIFGNRERPIFWLAFSFLAFAITSSALSLLSIKGNFVFPVLLIVIGGIMLKQSRSNDEPLFKVEVEKDEE